MPRYVAFLRAINVGGRTVKMDHLRALFEGMGFDGDETFIASGNVMLNSSARSGGGLEKKIEVHLHDSLGYEVATFVRTVKDVVRIAEHAAFPQKQREREGAVEYVAFLKAPLAQGQIAALRTLENPVDSFHVDRTELYWLRQQSVGETQMSNALFEKTLKIRATNRNMNTVRKIAAKYA